MPRAAHLHLKPEAIRLRVEEQLSLKSICRKLGVPQGTLSAWLQPYPLSPEVLHKALARPGPRPHRVKHQRPAQGFSQMVDVSSMSRRQKMQIAEAAVLFRLSVFGFDIYRAEFDGDRVDWLVDTKAGFKRVQVRWASPQVRGLPSIKTTCAEGAHGYRPLGPQDFDFLVGYDFFSDTAYVFTLEEVTGNRSSITVREDVAERWDKLAS